MKIVHLTSVHTRYDTRIFLKQCRSLAAAGHAVSLIVADGKGNESRDGVSILDAGPQRSRPVRMTLTTWEVLRLGLRQDADVYHLHDPELLPAALWLKARGKRVIFDAHEDLPRQILSKPYLPAGVRKLASWAAEMLERTVCPRLDWIVAATPAIRDKFEAMGVPATTVCNFPMLGELESEAGWTAKARGICYVGGISGIRGIREVVAALPHCRSGAHLILAGQFMETRLRNEVMSLPGWTAVEELGFVSRTDVKSVLARSMAGLVTFLPAPNHTEAQPNKMFEYMSAGLPVIASHFPLWHQIIEGNQCGICVDPADPVAIAAAIDRLMDDPANAQRMGENGRRAVYERYNWEHERNALLNLYVELGDESKRLVA